MEKYKSRYYILENDDINEPDFGEGYDDESEAYDNCDAQHKVIEVCLKSIDFDYDVDPGVYELVTLDIKAMVGNELISRKIRVELDGGEFINDCWITSEDGQYDDLDGYGEFFAEIYDVSEIGRASCRERVCMFV